MDLYKASFIFLAILLSASCSHRGIVDGAEVTLAKPEKVVSMAIDTTLKCDFSEVLHCYLMQIVNDTILVLQEGINDNNFYHFKAYSTNTFEYLGPFVRSGRGPGEMTYSHIAKTNTSEKYLTVDDIQTGYLIDVENSIGSKKTAIVKTYGLPEDVIYWIPLQDSTQFIFQIKKEGSSFLTIGQNGNIINTSYPFKDIDVDTHATLFSTIIVNDGYSGMVAQVMMFFPQINLIDTNTGIIRTIAVDKIYKKWNSVLNYGINLNTMSTYVAATSSHGYIIAAYRYLPISKLYESGQGSSIHIFDWDGNFLYDVKVEENINDMTFDGKNKLLYCVDTNGKIFRYDLSGLIY